MRWKDNLIKEFLSQLKNGAKDGESIIDQIVSNDGIGLHMAIFNEPFLSAILDKRKLYESRFSIKRINPYRKVYNGDIVLIKRNAGKVIGFFVVGKVDYWIKNNKTSLHQLEIEYAEKICSNLDSDFWKNRINCKYGTFIEIREIHLFKSFGIDKQDRTTWIILKERYNPSIFDTFKELHDS